MFPDIPEYQIFKLTPNTVAKRTWEMDEDAVDSIEANALKIVFEKTTIPVPRLRRVVHNNGRFLLVMDFVKGKTLAEVWSSLSLWRKLHVAFTLRGYIRQLRRRLRAFPTDPPGPISYAKPQECISPLFTQIQPYRGPFASYADLSTFFNDRCQMACRDAEKCGGRAPVGSFDNSEPLVFTHQDLNPRNIILGDDGRLWIVDWAWAGFYPPWFEHSSMLIQEENEVLVMRGSKHALWRALIPFICGPYFQQHEWWGRMASSFIYK